MPVVRAFRVLEFTSIESMRFVNIVLVSLENIILQRK